MDVRQRLTLHLTKAVTAPPGGNIQHCSHFSNKANNEVEPNLQRHYGGYGPTVGRAATCHGPFWVMSPKMATSVEPNRVCGEQNRLVQCIKKMSLALPEEFLQGPTE